MQFNNGLDGAKQLLLSSEYRSLEDALYSDEAAALFSSLSQSKKDKE